MSFKPNIINLHFIDFCNYNCSYCFVKKENKILSLENIKTVIENISSYFIKNNLVGRINLVGGEIFLCSYLQEIIDYICKLNIEVSIVTNGSLIDEKFIINNVGKIYTIGLSIDSLNENTNIKIGRCCKGKSITQDQLINICKNIKKNGIKLKINHCISKFNYNENIASFIEVVEPDRFKVFQMTVVEGINDLSKQNQISKEEFDFCCEKYKHLNPIIENEEEMSNSYLIIDSLGDFYCDKKNKPLGNLLKDSFDDLVNNLEIDIKSFKKRYSVL